MSGIVYLLHFDRPIGNLSNPRGQAQHYIGYTTNLEQRIQAHRAGHSASIVRAFRSQGIDFQVARTWKQKRTFERKLKTTCKNAKRHCPICQELARKVTEYEYRN